MTPWNQSVREMVRALCVLALIFLNFAHVPLAAAGESVATTIASSVCGDPIGYPGEAKAKPCQACRIGSGADLPPVPSTEELAHSEATLVAYAANIEAPCL